MNINIKDITNNLTIIDKDNIIHEKGDTIVNINIDDINYDTKFDKAIKLIALITEMNNIEYEIYRTIIINIIVRDNMMLDSTIIDFGKTDIQHIANITNKSTTHIYRNLSSLISKGILRYYKDNKGVPVNAKYIINPKYDASKYFNKNIANYILIQL